jgi:hypothetical protein
MVPDSVSLLGPPRIRQPTKLPTYVWFREFSPRPLPRIFPQPVDSMSSVNSRYHFIVHCRAVKPVEVIDIDLIGVQAERKKVHIHTFALISERYPHLLFS